MNRNKMMYILVCISCIMFICTPSCGKTQKAEKRRQVNKQSLKRMEIPLDAGSQGAAPSLRRNIYFIFDASGSMRKAPDKSCMENDKVDSKIQGAKKAVQEFIKKIPEDVNVGLYVFDARGQNEVVQLGENNFEKFGEAINEIKPGGSTPLARSIIFGADRLIDQYKKQLGYGEFRLVIVTDGLAKDIEDAAVYTIRKGIPIYVIGLCLKEEHPLREWALWYRAADNYGDLEKGLEQTVAELPDFDETEFRELSR